MRLKKHSAKRIRKKLTDWLKSSKIELQERRPKQKNSLDNKSKTVLNRNKKNCYKSKKKKSDRSKRLKPN